MGTGTLRWRALTLLLYAAGSALGLAAVIRSFDRELDVGLVVWTFGMIAGVFGLAMAVLALAAIGRRDDDRADIRSVTGVALLAVSGPVTTGWLGAAAAALLFAGWLVWRFERRRRHTAWRDEFAERQAFLRSLGKRDPREDPDGARFLGGTGVTGAGPEVESAPSSDGYATTRRELKERAREIDSDPWRQPPQ